MQDPNQPHLRPTTIEHKASAEGRAKRQSFLWAALVPICIYTLIAVVLRYKT